MATVGLPTCCSCARYLSPTRWDFHLTPRTILHQPKHYSQTQRQSRGSSMATKRFSPATKGLEAFQDLKNGIKAWAKANRPTFDVQSIVRVVGTINVELPKNFPDYRNLMIGWKDRDKKDENESALMSASNNSGKQSSKLVSDHGNGDNVQSAKIQTLKEECELMSAKETNVKDKENYKFNDFEEFRQKRRELLEKTDSSTILREQHDLEQSFNYYSSISFPDMPSESQDKKKVKSASRESQVATSSLVRAYSNTVSRYIPQVIMERVLPKPSSPEKTPQNKNAVKADLAKNHCISRTAVERVTKGAVIKLRKATSNASRLLRLEEMCKQLMQHPESRCYAKKERVIPLLMELRKAPDQAIREQANQALVLMGHIDTLPRRGVRVLSLDGGGTRALVAIEILKQIEAASGKPIYELFDLVCGVSTGSLLGAMLSIWRLPLSEIEHIYKEFSTDMFTRSRVIGAYTSVRSHAYYNTEEWEKILQETLGFKSFLDTTKDPNNPKICIVSSIVNVSGLQNFLFRNYSYPLNVESIYIGSMKYKLWEGIRASSAAPLYYQEFKRDQYVHQDGGVLQNNPSAIALHEAKLLWPHEDLHCVVSIGNGRFAQSMTDNSVASSSIRQKLTRIIDSATDTEAVHTVLNDLLPPCSYFRFNPYMSEEFSLDEVRRDKWDAMQQDAKMYLRKNEFKLKLAAERLTAPRRVDQQAKDWIKSKQEFIENRLR